MTAPKPGIKTLDRLGPSIHVLRLSQTCILLLYIIVNTTSVTLSNDFQEICQNPTNFGDKHRSVRHLKPELEKQFDRSAFVGAPPPSPHGMLRLTGTDISPKYINILVIFWKQ